jgi:glycosyltransferase involved in cell wall biosynthesis
VTEAESNGGPGAPAAVAPPPGVVHVVVSLDAGGLERVVLDLLREGRKLGQDASVICLERPGKLAQEAEAQGFRVLCADKRPGLRWSTVSKVAALLGQLRPAVVHSHQSGALLYAGPAARRAGVPVVVHTEHNNHLRKQGTPIARLRRTMLAKLSGRRAQRFFCVSADVADAVRKHGLYPADKTFVVPNGIDLAPFEEPLDRAAVRQSVGIPADAPVVGTVGRLNAVKRQDLLIRAFARVKQAVPDAHLLIVGDGAAMGELRELTATLSLNDAVHFAGYQPKPQPYLRAMDVFALTSRIEGMPLSVLEAFAAGVPVVASRVGGVPEVVDSGNNGFVFEYGDETALVGRLLELLNGPELARHVGEAGRDSARSRYSAAVMAAAYHRHYLELLGHVDLNPTSYRPVPTVSYVPTHA